MSNCPFCNGSGTYVAHRRFPQGGGGANVQVSCSCTPRAVSYDTTGWPARAVGRLEAHLGQACGWDGETLTRGALYSRGRSVSVVDNGSTRPTYWMEIADGSGLIIPKMVADAWRRGARVIATA